VASYSVTEQPARQPAASQKRLRSARPPAPTLFHRAEATTSLKEPDQPVHNIHSEEPDKLVSTHPRRQLATPSGTQKRGQVTLSANRSPAPSTKAIAGVKPELLLLVHFHRPMVVGWVDPESEAATGIFGRSNNVDGAFGLGAEDPSVSFLASRERVTAVDRSVPGESQISIATLGSLITRSNLLVKTVVIPATKTAAVVVNTAKPIDGLNVPPSTRTRADAVRIPVPLPKMSAMSNTAHTSMLVERRSTTKGVGFQDGPHVPFDS